MPATNRYSLWLVPEGAVEDALQAVIDRLCPARASPVDVPPECRPRLPLRREVVKSSDKRRGASLFREQQDGVA